MPAVRMCLNPKIVAALLILGVAALVVAPNLIVSILPVLIVAACPLSMLLMAGRMSHQETRHTSSSASSEEVAALVAEVNALRAHVQKDQASATENQS